MSFNPDCTPCGKNVIASIIFGVLPVSSFDAIKSGRVNPSAVPSFDFRWFSPTFKIFLEL